MTTAHCCRVVSQENFLLDGIEPHCRRNDLRKSGKQWQSRQIDALVYMFGGIRIAVKRGNRLFRLHSDHLGSTSLTTAESAVEASRAYYAYGAERSATGDLQTDRTFTGQKRDVTGILYPNARYDDSALGTFISPSAALTGVLANGSTERALSIPKPS